MTEQVESNVLTALEAWKGASLSKLMLKYSETGEEIIENQKICLQSRRSLAEKTKEFRKQNDGKNTTEIKALLKAYQNEIDSLSKKMKFSENALLSLINTLSDLPDPEPFLAQMNEMSHSLATASKQKQEILKLKNDNGLLVRKLQKSKDLEEKNESLKKQLEKANEKMEELVTERVIEKEREIKEDTEGLIEYLKSRERDLQQQVSESQQNLEILRDSHDMTQSELLQLSQNRDRSLSTRVAEIDIMQANLDRANNNIINLQLQNSALKSEILVLKEGVGSSSTISELKNQIENQESEISRLVGELEQSTQSVYSSEINFQQTIENLKQTINVKDKSIETLTKKQESQKDYNEIKRELDIIKSVEFSNIWDGEDAESNNFNKNENHPLEKMLIKKNQHLQNLLTAANNSISELKSSCDALEKKNRGLMEDLKLKVSLVAKLEGDLLNFDSANDDNTSLNAGGNSDEVSETLSQQLKPGNNPSELQSSSSGKSVLTIVTNQRDRFRQRNVELELELRKQHTLSSELQSKLDRLESDNVGLYQQIRYLRSYSSINKGPNSSNNIDIESNSQDYSQGNAQYRNNTSVSIPAQNSHSGISVSNGSLAAASDRDEYYSRSALDDSAGSTQLYGNYQEIYEDSINPFRRFKRSEASRRYRSMTILDKVSWHLSRIFLTRKWSRLMLIIYSLFIHLFLFVQVTNLSSCKSKLPK